MSAIGKTLRGLTLAAAIVGGALVVTMMVLITIEVIQRSFFGVSFLFVEEYSGYMVLAVLALGVGLALQDDALLRVDLLIDRIGTEPRRWLQLFYDICGLVFCVILAYQFTTYAFRNFGRGIFAPTPMMTPIYIPQAILALGFILLCLALITKLVADFTRTRPSEDKPHDQSHVL